MRGWVRRTQELQRELADIADVDARSWLLAGSVALAETRTTDDVYLACDTEPASDTFMGYPAPAPADPLADAITRARAAREALRELDGTLPGQPLAVAIDRGEPRACSLDAVAFAVADRCIALDLDDPSLLAKLASLVAGAPLSPSPRTPFACISIGDEPLATARHGHRRAWGATAGGPWLGLGRAGGLAIVSTCHLVVDGFGHALITRRISELTPTSSPSHLPLSLPPLAPAPGAVPLAVVWRPLPAAPPRVTAFAYRLGILLQREVGRPGARFSPTIQIPVARGAKDDPLRLRRRIVSATTSVRFPDNTPEPFASFESRVHDVFAREAADRGLASRLLAAARAVPVPRAWKRRSIAAKRPRWMEGFAEVIGGRALLSRISLDVSLPLICAISSPSRLATTTDPHGGCVITIVDDGHRGAIAMCGSGFAGTEARANALLDELLT